MILKDTARYTRAVSFEAAFYACSFFLRAR
jgi:hypothetical protein